MTSGVVEQVFPGGVVTREQQNELIACDDAILLAVKRAKASGVPQGLIVALLHGHAHAQTARMIEL